MLEAEQDQKFQRLVKRAQQGDTDAIESLIARYNPEIRQEVRRYLNRKLRQKVDSIDLVQDVWGSFFRQFPNKNPFENPKKLTAFLVKLARHRAIDAFRKRLKSQKYNVNKECSLENSGHFEADQFSDRQPTPSKLLMQQEEWENFLAKLPPLYQKVMIWLKEGKSCLAVAQKLGVSERSVRRILKNIKSKQTPPKPAEDKSPPE